MEVYIYMNIFFNPIFFIKEVSAAAASSAGTSLAPLAPVISASATATSDAASVVGCSAHPETAPGSEPAGSLQR